MYTVNPNPLPKRTVSPAARRLHSLLRSVEGYAEAIDSPRRVAWTLDAIAQLSAELPAGCSDAVAELSEALPFFTPRLVKVLTIEHLCKVITDLAFYCAYQNAEEEAFDEEQSRR